MPKWKTAKFPSILEMEEESKKSFIPPWALKILFFLILILAIIFAWSVYNYKKVSLRTKNISTPQSQLSSPQGNPEELVKKVGSLIILPANERPSIATINNVAQLQKNQPFYADAHNGDLLLLYFQAKKAYIYSPSKNIIVNVGPLVLEKEQASTPVISATSTTSTSSTTST